MRPHLTGAPFYLSGGDVRWVNETKERLTDDEKLRQLLCLITYSDDEEYCRYLGETVRPGGFLCRNLPGEKCVAAIARMQKYSAIPLLVAANLESGGNGVATDGTPFAKQMAVAAAGDPENARRLAEICAAEGSAVGVNWAFAPVADIDFNWRNPITNTRTYGSDPDRVRAYTVTYVKELQRHGMAACMKHFPGDGCDERDQHVAPSVNPMTEAEWEKTYGGVYRAGIAGGVMTVMAGHILLPEYVRENGGSEEDAMLPASVNPYLLNGLLREKLGFNGLIVTDSSVMAGIAALVPREELVPAAIAAGCDMFLFTKDLEEDIRFLREGFRRGVITLDRLDDAVTRVLALKAALGLHRKAKDGTLLPTAEHAEKTLASPRFAGWSRECADRAITLVKEEEGVLPITPERYPRILFYPLENRPEGASVMPTEGDPNRLLKELLIKRGFSVTEFTPAAGFEGMMTPISETVGQYDLILYAAALATRSNQTTVRIEWANPMGANVPTFCHTLPTVFVSFENPYHLFDVPQVRTYINCYSPYPAFVEALVEKLTGKSGFYGTSPVDPFCGRWETKRAYGGKTAREEKVL